MMFEWKCVKEDRWKPRMIHAIDWTDVVFCWGTDPFWQQLGVALLAEMKHAPLQGTQDLPSGGENATVPWSDVNYSTLEGWFNWHGASWHLKRASNLYIPIRVSSVLVCLRLPGLAMKLSVENGELFCFSLVLKTLKLSSFGFGDISIKAHELLFGTVTCCTLLQWCSIRNEVFIFDLIIFSHGKSPMGRGICPWHSASATSKLLCLGLRRRWFWSTDSEHAHECIIYDIPCYIIQNDFRP